MNLYIYNGPVMEFGVCIAHNWYAETRAPTERKARSNLTYQYKKQHNKSSDSKIVLMGKIELVEEEIVA